MCKKIEEDNSYEWFCDDCFYISEKYSKFEDLKVCSDCGSENIIKKRRTNADEEEDEEKSL